MLQQSSAELLAADYPDYHVSVDVTRRFYRDKDVHGNCVIHISHAVLAKKKFSIRERMCCSLANINNRTLCASSVPHISRLLLVRLPAMPPHSSALVPDLASALGPAATVGGIEGHVNVTVSEAVLCRA